MLVLLIELWFIGLIIGLVILGFFFLVGLGGIVGLGSLDFVRFILMFKIFFDFRLLIMVWVFIMFLECILSEFVCLSIWLMYIFGCKLLMGICFSIIFFVRYNVVIVFNYNRNE